MLERGREDTNYLSDLKIHMATHLCRAEVRDEEKVHSQSCRPHAHLSRTAYF